MLLSDFLLFEEKYVKKKKYGIFDNYSYDDKFLGYTIFDDSRMIFRGCENCNEYYFRGVKYYQENKRSVEKITRFDIFKLQHWLPAALLKIPYDYLNRANRKKLLADKSASTLDISIEDYRLDHAEDEQCFDFFVVATK